MKQLGIGLPQLRFENVQHVLKLFSIVKRNRESRLKWVGFKLWELVAV